MRAPLPKPQGKGGTVPHSAEARTNLFANPLQLLLSIVRFGEQTRLE